MYLTMLQDRLRKRQQFLDLLGDSSSTNKLDSDKLCDLPVHYIAFSSSSGESIGYVGVGNQNRGKLAMISFFKEGATNLNMLDLEFDCRPVSMVIYDNGMAFISLLSGYVIALQLNEGDGQILWELKLNDIALKLVHAENKLYAGLANGTLTVLEDAFNKAPTALDLYHIPISAAPVTDAIIVEDYLYLAVACKIVILNKSTLSPIGNIYVAASASGSTAPMFEKIRAISNSPRGIWIITAHSSLIQLWKESECQLLFDVTYDHSHRKPSFSEEDDFNNVEINAILYHDDEIWIGTLDGYLMLYKVVPTDGTTESKPISRSDGDLTKKIKPNTSNEISFSLHRYPPGKRLQPDNNVPTTIPIHRQQMYYIPTPKETQNEENASLQEHQASEMERRKISVVIDQNTKQYSVSVAPLRSISVDSATGTMKTPSTSTQNTISTPLSRTNPLNLTITKKLQLRQKHHVLEKERSVDSAVSVFSDHEHGIQKSPTDSEGSPRFVQPIEEATEPEAFAFSTGGASLEYDDMFEMYSDQDAPTDIGLIEDVLQN
uniref:Uncharacterized protein n=1 Tax=Panagrolaimus sp. JU765 TaxID=591449 RepID=A0AC34R7H0_9BILA